ncbi:unnamed protein product [Calypogeia fissa]
MKILSKSSPPKMLLLIFIYLGFFSPDFFLAMGDGDPKFPCNENNGFPFCNRTLSDEARVADLVSRLTTAEKIGLIVNTATAVPRLGIPSYEWWNEGLHGVAWSPGVSFDDGKIPAAASFPQPILTAASFNRSLFNEIARVVSTEARAMHNLGQAGLTYWTPNINLFRDPRWGRGQETPGEDPLLTGAYAEYFVRGLQEDGPYAGDATKPAPARLKVSACCKHFTAYDLDAWEGVERYGFDATVQQRDLDDSFNPPFQACIQNGRASGLMCSYNSVNGVPSCANKDLLTKLARNTWGFDGYVVSDCDAVQNVYANHYYADPAGSVSVTLKAGMDINCGDTLKNYTEAALEQKLIDVDDIDVAMTRSFAVQFRLGIFDGNPVDQDFGSLGKSNVCTDEHQQLALEAALQGIVLLKNEDNTLPFSPKKIQTLAVIGPNADDSLNTMVGNYAGNPCKYVTPLKGFGEYVDTLYVAGCNETACETADADAASAAAARADATVIVVGLGLDQEREALDRTDLLLPGQQKDLILAVADSAKGPVVLVLMTGGCLDISFAEEDPRIGAIVWVGYPGEAGGNALGQIVFGEKEPSGKLPSTWYRNELISPWAMTNMDMRPNPKTGYPGRSYRFYNGEPLYEFGYGLSYTKIVHSFSSNSTAVSLVAPTAEQLRCGATDRVNGATAEDCAARDASYCENLVFRVQVEVSIAEEGNSLREQPVSDVVLLYVSPPGAGENGLPIKQLVGFTRVAIFPKESTKNVVEFAVDPCKQFSTVASEVALKSTAQVFLEGDYILSLNGGATMTVHFAKSVNSLQ